MLGATTGIIGTMQAMETVKLLAEIGDLLKGKLMVCDFRDMYFITINIFKRPDCSGLVWLCGRQTANVNPPHPIDMELDEIHNRLKRHFKMLVKSSLVIVFEYDGDVEVSLFRPGRMLIKNVEDEKAALKVYKDIINKLGVKISLD